MASLCTRLIARNVRSFLLPCRTFADRMMPDPMELATGLEKKEILAKQAGNDDPFHLKVQKRGLGTKDAPTQVPSCFDSRIIGCICEEDATAINWMWLHKGTAKRCECGHWYKLTHQKQI